MDGRDIEWEISTLTAEMRRVEKQRDTALAGFETAQRPDRRTRGETAEVADRRASAAASEPGGTQSR